MDVILRTWRALPRLWPTRTWPSQPAELVLAGTLLGLLSSCSLTQFHAHWGTSAPIERGVIVTAIVGILAGWQLQSRSALQWPVGLMLSATLSLIFSWWLDQTTELTAWLPLSLSQSFAGISGIGLGISCLSLFLPMMCWSATLCAVSGNGNSNPTEARRIVRFVSFSSGCAGGIILTAMVFGPTLGLEITTIVSAACALTLSYRVWSKDDRQQPITQTASHVPQSWSQLSWTTLGLLGCGGAISLSAELTNQLMPQTVYIQQISWAILFLGFVAGIVIAQRSTSTFSRLAWAISLLIAGMSFNYLLFETGIRISLWFSAFLIDPTWHQGALAALIAVTLLPVSIAGGLLIGSPRPGVLITGFSTVLITLSLGHEVVVASMFGMNLELLAVLLICGMSLLVVTMMLTTRSWPTVKWQAALMLVVLIGGGLSPWWRPALDPSLPSKLLFSTSSFVAYRDGWPTKLLPQLEDTRLVASVPGRHGPLTVWKSRGSELVLREAGVPRCAIECRTDISPQLPSEVLQVVFPLLIAQETRHVLLLGSSGGVPLSTCLSFPVQQVRCVEPDSKRIELIRGPIATERSYDPFTDDRVRIDRRSVELAAAMSDGNYDVIISSPPLSAVTSALPQFTTEFYRHVARKLSTNGLFCQRFEAVDYGPSPWQLVAQSLLESFRDVVAVEIGVGEYLFLATNSEQGLVPAELPSRLETPHVRRVLARCAFDWSTLLTLSAWDRPMLQEIIAEGSSRANTAANCQLAYTGPRDMLRWSPKLQEVHNLLSKPRGSTANDENGLAKSGEPASRRARYLDWLGEEAATKDLMRRLSEVASQVKIVIEHPDSFWLEYRKPLRDQLQQRPRTEIRQVSASDESERVLHAEDEHRKNYFLALGVASNRDEQSWEAVWQLTEFFEPFDPLLSLFARQETAELLKLIGHPDPAAELAMRLHVINFAPRGDRSLRNVLSAAELLLQFPDAVPDPQNRFDQFNDLLQTFRHRWEVRSASQIKSYKWAIHDVDRSIVVIEKMIAAMNELRPATAIAAHDWELRKEVLERVLLRPLRSYRGTLVPKYQENKMKANAVLQESQAKKSSP